MKSAKLLLTWLCVCTAIVSASYDAKLALDMVYASGLAYCSAATILSGKCGQASKKTDELGMEVLHAKDNDLSENGITYAILKRAKSKQIIVSFSGTRDIEQLITEIAEAYWCGYQIHPQIQDAKVFVYFYKHYMDGFRDDFTTNIQKVMKSYTGYDVIFTGHSLGGAMTVHAAGDFILSGWGKNRKTYIYTYGQPRIGNPEFTDSFHSQLAGWYRLVHNKDIVAHIPPCLPGITNDCIHDGHLPFYPYHASEEIYYDEPFEKYIACSLSDGEDPKCSKDHLNDSIPDHLVYFGINIGGLSQNEGPVVQQMLK